MKRYIKDIQILSASSAEGARSQLKEGFIPIYMDINKGAGGDSIFLWVSWDKTRGSTLDSIDVLFDVIPPPLTFV